MTLILFAASATASTWRHPVSGQDALATPANGGYPAQIYGGPCDTIDPEVIAPLTMASPLGGSDEQGWVFSSASVVDIPLGDLVSAGHSLAVSTLQPEASSGIALACGEIAGDAASGTVVIGLASTGSGDLAGIALLTDAGANQTEVEIYLIMTGDGTSIGSDDPVDGEGIDDDDEQESANPDV